MRVKNLELNVALIAHDKMKDQMVNFCYAYQHILRNYGLYTTGTTGKRIEEGTALSVHKLASGPLGGDQQIGALVSEQKLDLVIFLRDPLTSQPHEPDINALLRLCDVYEIPLATNVSTAQLVLDALHK